MISVEEARNIIEQNTFSLESVSMPTLEGLGHIIAENCLSPIDMPPFPQSAMDGYALNFIENVSSYKLIGEIKAGDSGEFINLKPGEACRIFTGAIVPEGANLVAKQEVTQVIGNSVQLLQNVPIHDNIRFTGEQIKKDQIAVNGKTLITPGIIGYLYMLGTQQIEVIRKPVIRIITTGNELLSPGNTLEPGKIYESNSFMLKAALKQYGFDAENITIKDDPDNTKNSIRENLELADVLIITGGISVGDYDFVHESLIQNSVKPLFYKVKQKPGKPMFFGRKDNRIVYGLPGNPAAVLSCFYQFVLPALFKLSGHDKSPMIQKTVTLNGNYTKTNKLTHFLKGNYRNNTVEILTGQSSAMLNSYVDANCLIELPETKETFAKGDQVTITII